MKKPDYTNMQKTEVVPNAGSMIETFRAIGYNLGTALADIIDNSITAKAKNIWIETKWNGSETTIAVKDDGEGMNGNELINAMTPSSQDPSLSRDESDLGRFGLGLKTASFSQCRVLTVVSKKIGYNKTYWTWDLDYVKSCGRWELLRWLPESYSNVLDDKEQKQGTVVIWSAPDRIVAEGTAPDDLQSKMKFFDQLDIAQKHIAMTFHRFIQDKTVKIYFGESELVPWDPFCQNESSTQMFPVQELYFGKECAEVRGYVLPHKSKFSSEDAYKNSEGMFGQPAQQGFYVYRGRRLLVAGSWLGLFRKEEHYKLVRIKIDLPNTLDTTWKIDIKKSTATPPAICKEKLKSYAMVVRNKGVEVFRHRGKILKQKAGSCFQPLWLDKKKDNKWSFVVNRENQVIKELTQLAHTEPDKAISHLLRFIEESLPTKAIFIKESEADGSQKEPFYNMDMELLTSTLHLIYEKSLAEGRSKEESIAYLKTIEPFNNFENLINDLI